MEKLIWNARFVQEAPKKFLSRGFLTWVGRVTGNDNIFLVGLKALWVSWGVIGLLAHYNVKLLHWHVECYRASSDGTLYHRTYPVPYHPTNPLNGDKYRHSLNYMNSRGITKYGLPKSLQRYCDTNIASNMNKSLSPQLCNQWPVLMEGYLWIYSSLQGRGHSLSSTSSS